MKGGAPAEAGAHLISGNEPGSPDQVQFGDRLGLGSGHAGGSADGGCIGGGCIGGGCIGGGRIGGGGIGGGRLGGGGRGPPPAAPGAGPAAPRGERRAPPP